ncbi:MAG: hypothetical protein NZ773_13970, partial [Dehalococcoidia bacterium]|nr:hypothetical protein [Dehalococcoidia bacterium]
MPTRTRSAAALLLLLIAGLVLALFPPSTAARSPLSPPPSDAPLTTLVTDGIVNAVARAGNAIYLGGNFTSVGPPTGSF